MEDADVPSRRRSQFKKGIDAEEGRRRRENDLVTLRRNKRDETLTKRRQMLTVKQEESHDSCTASPSFSQKALDDLPSMVAGVWSDQATDQFNATQKFRKLLSIERNPPIDDVIKQGVIPRFVHFLEKNDFPKLQFEAAWALTNVASGTSEHTKVVIDNQAIPIFVRLLLSPNDDVREQAVWALGNIAGDSPRCRDLVLNADALGPLLEQLKDNNKLSMLRNATWTLSNFCRGKPQPDFEKTQLALPSLARHIHNSDEEILTDACWALSYLSDGTNDKIDKVIQSGVCRRLCELLAHQSTAVLVPALRTVGNIVTGDDVQTQVIINCGALSHLLVLLTTSHKKSIKKEACWTISNITAGTIEQIQAVINANIIPPLVHLLQTAEFDIKKEAAWAISNATSGGTQDQIRYLVSCGCIKPLCDLLVTPDARIIIVALEGLENILKVGEEDKIENNGTNPFIALIESAEGLDKIEQLQEHQNQDIYDKAVNILETYFELEEMEYEDLAPTIDNNTGGYTFGNNSGPPAGGFNFGQN